jgi:hypothetical protein
MPTPPDPEILVWVAIAGAAVWLVLPLIRWTAAVVFALATAALLAGWAGWG